MKTVRILLCAVAAVLLGQPAQWANGQSTSQQAAGDDGTTFAKGAKAAAAQIPDQEVSNTTIPGYQPAPKSLSGLMGGSDGSLLGAAGPATGSEAWQLMRSADANRGRVDPSSLQDIFDRSEQINQDASGSTTGGGIGGTQGKCEEITQSPTQVYYDATCEVGEKLTSSPPVMQYECPPGWSLSGTSCSMTLTQPANAAYSCPAGSSLQGTSCVTTQPATPSYSCPSGGVLQGDQCVSSQPAATAHSCPSGGEVQGTDCVTTTPAAVGAYTCPSGFALAGSSCTRTTTESATISGYSCPTDFALDGATCRRTLQQSATPVYACPPGYDLNGASCTSGATYQASVAFSCPSGFTLSGSTCSQVLSQPAAGTAICPSGHVLSNGVCAMHTSYAATATTTCPPGWILQASQCIQSTNYAATVVYTCPPKYYADGATCRPRYYQCGGDRRGQDYYVVDGQPLCGTPKTYYASGKCPTTAQNPFFVMERKISGITQCLTSPNSPYTCAKDHYSAPNDGMCFAYFMSDVPAATNYSCPNGDTLSGTTCSGYNYLGTTIQYSCPNGGTLSGTTCEVESTTAPTTEYSCPAGYTLSGSTCSTTTTQAATATYTCPNGGTLTGTVCSTASSTPATVSYNCPAEWVLAGDQCTSTASQAATPIYSCPVGYDLSGSMCSQTEVQPATAQYVCPAGATLSGTTCMARTTATVTYSCPAGGSLTGSTCSSVAAAAVAYSCPAGGTLSGSDCGSSAAATATYSCPSGYVLSDTTCSQTLTQGANGTLVCEGGATMNGGACYTSQTQSDCDTLAANPQCSFTRDTCLDEEPNGPCRVMEKTYKCPVPGDQGPPNKEYVCGGDIYCVDGSCQEVERDPSNELKQALVALGAIDQAHKEFDPDKLDMFKGTRETCHKPVFGLVNCCAGKVSGLLSGGAAYAAHLAGAPALLTAVATQFLTYFLCSNEEKMLDVKDRLGLCHFVGSYCSSSFLGVCQTKRKAYCCFESKLSRILQEQGRPQIGKAWDKPKTESCKGFTIDEFSRLDLSQMDFTEIYAEFLEAAKLPDEAQMATDIQVKIKAYYQQNGAN